MMGDTFAQAEHSPFIREVLGPLADSVTPAPPPGPYEDLALLWCVQGVEEMDDPAAAAKSLAIAVSYGSNDALAWLGAALIDYAYIHDQLDRPEWREIAIEGLGWLDLAHRCGVTFADQFFAYAQAHLPASIVNEWAVRPPLFIVPVH